MAFTGRYTDVSFVLVKQQKPSVRIIQQKSHINLPDATSLLVVQIDASHSGFNFR